MSAQTYAAQARKHWTKWLPRKVASLKQAGELEQALQTAGKRAQQEVTALMQQGFRQHEAEEVALKQYIVLDPEPQVALEPWEEAELGKLERQYQQNMKETPER